jgi:hypothetical protein
MPEMAARTLCRSARLRTQFCGVLQKAPLKRITREWLENYLECQGETYPAQLMYK